MEPPKDVEVHETPTSRIWLGKDGILYSITKPNAPKLSPEQSRNQLDDFMEKFGNKKQCMLIDVKYAQPNTPEERKQSAELLPKVTKAMAVIVHNPLGRMVVNLFIGLEKPKYPMKIFKPGDEEKAREWLKKYL